jgi:hypothetical protein
MKVVRMIVVGEDAEVKDPKVLEIVRKHLEAVNAELKNLYSSPP